MGFWQDLLREFGQKSPGEASTDVRFLVRAREIGGGGVQKLGHNSHSVPFAQEAPRGYQGQEYRGPHALPGWSLENGRIQA